jgi:hypothetical protein
MRSILLWFLAASACAAAGCARPAPPPAPMPLDTPAASLAAVQAALAEGRFGDYYDRMLSAASRRAAAEVRASLQRRLGLDPIDSQFDPEFAELAAAGLDADRIRTLDERAFAVALLAARFRAPGGDARRPHLEAIGTRQDGDRAEVRYRVGGQSPIVGVMHFVREEDGWKVEDLDLLAAAAEASSPPPQGP